MLKKEQIANLLVLGGTAIIAVKFETVELKGRAMIDSVEYRGTRRLRAKFGHGIKAILLMDEYGNTWTAEKAPDPELEAADEEETTEPQEKKISPNCIMVQKFPKRLILLALRVSGCNSTHVERDTDDPEGARQRPGMVAACPHHGIVIKL